MPLMNIDAKNGLETYEELLERCKNFSPDDVYCLIMRIYFPIRQSFFDPEDTVIWDTFILGYTPDKDIADAFVEYHEKESTYYPGGKLNYVFDRGIIERELYDTLKKYPYVDFGFKFQRLRKVSIPKHKEVNDDIY